MNYDVYIQFDPMLRDSVVALSGETRAGNRVCFIDLVPTNIKQGEASPALFDPRDGKPGGTAFVQAILDEAWNTGMRPAGWHGEGDRQAVDQHLQDMRAITFGKLGIDKP